MDIAKNAYDMIIEAGQSNAQGCGRGTVTEEYIPDEDIMYLIQDDSSSHLHIEIADEQVDNDGKIGDFSLTFSKEYKKNGLLRKDRKILIIRAGVGGTGFKKKQWGLNDEVFLRMLRMIDYALSLNSQNSLVAFLWHQGEHDAFEGNEPDVFEAQLKAMITTVKNRYKVPKLPFVSGDFVNEWKSANIDICHPIVEKIKSVTAREDGIFVETGDLLSNNEKTGNGDVIHFCRESLHILGKRYFEAYQAISDRN